MALNIGKEMAALGRMTVPELRRKYAQVFGEDTASRHKEFLIRRIIWRLQANQESGLSERAKQRARELATESDIRLTAPRPRPVVPGGETATAPIEFPNDDRLPMPGAVITRRYKNQTIEVRVLPKGFEYEGEIYRTLSAVAKKVTAVPVGRELRDVPGRSARASRAARGAGGGRNGPVRPRCQPAR